ncbi:ethanolamine ammonia-lyase subunit EutC [Uliginosibacterium aquaticum]|uniref:Ethanolamine ammonia-lyase small subunit n=1 Tax=Uliginosibacterium aquaticum TaxID=2731212 RepID=A0ABX2IJK1_9RHOO|nr:ethanolamine ammonia-lyase subunit EutC [Uliginosibacterium aquaticum]NSL54235.1 ethanolamine ammonia-lyase subunit EutC [Uliginosibacterium aquaticum]
MSKLPITPDPWTRLRSLTPARLALGRSGVSLPTAEVLRFGLAHAQARDAVHEALDLDALTQAFSQAGFASLRVASQATDRATYLRRPDLGRRLAPSSAALLKQAAPASPLPLLIVVADGLSSLAISRHTLPLLQALLPYFPTLREAPVVIASQARVALGDEIGQSLNAALVAVLIGERPGLSSPDSLGIYLTGGPRVGLTDAWRNCISNVRPEGLDYAEAARKLAFLIAGARQLGRTGVDLKDDSDTPALESRTPMPELSGSD